MSIKYNNLVILFLLGIILLIILTIYRVCQWRRRSIRKRIYGPTVTVTSTTQQSHNMGVSPQMMPPYPIDARHPTPAHNAPAPGFSTHQAPYPTHTPNMPFPQGQTPYPPSGPTPYPPTSYPPPANDYSANPPPYDVAVSQAPIQPPSIKDGYVKQAPYNPGYN